MAIVGDSEQWKGYTVQHGKRIYRQRKRRGFRVRNKLKKHADRPRLCVHRSHKHITAQVIDDVHGRTLAAACTMEKAIKAESPYGGNKTAAAIVGKVIAARALAAGVKEVVFDRREYKYHGRVAALAQAAREAGLVL